MQPDEGLLAPDLVIFLDMRTSDGAKRGRFGAERYERVEFQSRVSACYRSLIQPSWIVLDASRPADRVLESALPHVRQIMAECEAGRRPVQRLWAGYRLGAAATK